MVHSCLDSFGREKKDSMVVLFTSCLVYGLFCSLTVSPPTMYYDYYDYYDYCDYYDYYDYYDYCDYRLNESFLQLDGVKVRDQVERTWANSYKASKKFLKEYPEMSKVALTLREETTEFKTLVPIIEALGNKAMKDRHWQVLAEETGTCG